MGLVQRTAAGKKLHGAVVRLQYYKNIRINYRISCIILYALQRTACSSSLSLSDVTLAHSPTTVRRNVHKITVYIRR
jgi:hypothetical protein